MIITCVDVETTGLDAEAGEIIELAVLSLCSKTKQLITMSSFLIKPKKNKISKEIESVTGITQDMIDRHGVDKDFKDNYIKDLISNCDYLCAHNATFDRSFIENTYGDIGKPWIDTLTDLPLKAYSGGSKRLTYLATDHGFVNPFPHRALPDVLTMARILMEYDIEEVIKRAESPLCRLIASVSFNDREKPKKAGFTWEPKIKKWQKDIKLCDYENTDYNFPVKKVDF